MKAKTKVKKKPQVTKIHQYVMGRAQGCRRKVGVLVGILDGNQHIRIGWSRVNFNAGDKFDQERGLKLAEERTKAFSFVSAPHSLKRDLKSFSARCARYFKDRPFRDMILTFTKSEMLEEDLFQ